MDIAYWVICMLLVAGFVVYDIAYAHGQIDALTGKVKYELVVKPDSTRVWQRIKTNR